MVHSVGNTLTALSAYRKKMNVIANNVANVLTDEFKKGRVTLSENQSGGVSTTIDQVDAPGIPKDSIRDDQIVQVESSNVDLAEELTEMIPTKSAYSANLKALRTQNDMLGSLLDIMS